MSGLDANHEVDKAAGVDSRRDVKGVEQASSVHGCRAAPQGYDVELPKVGARCGFAMPGYASPSSLRAHASRSLLQARCFRLHLRGTTIAGRAAQVTLRTLTRRHTRLASLIPLSTDVQTLASIEDLIPDTPNERLKNILDEAAALVHGNDEYLRQCTSDPTAAADALEHKTRTANWKELAARGETMFEFVSAPVMAARVHALVASLTALRRTRHTYGISSVEAHLTRIPSR